eukprot:4378425-Amphidinium_carterae.2
MSRSTCKFSTLKLKALACSTVSGGLARASVKWVAASFNSAAFGLSGRVQSEFPDGVLTIWPQSRLLLQLLRSLVAAGLGGLPQLALLQQKKDIPFGRASSSCWVMSKR